MAALASFLVEHPVITLFVVVGLGFLVGEIRLLGFRLGVAGVLFAGLGVGAASPGLAIPEVVPTTGLVLFVYTIGLAAGPTFFSSGPGWRASALALVALSTGAALTAALALALGIPAPRAAGLYAGALTNTPALAAVTDRVRELGRERGDVLEDGLRAAGQAVVGYSIAYPFGVLGALLAFQLFRRFWGEETVADEGGELAARDFRVRNRAAIGRTVEQASGDDADRGFVVSRVRHRGRVEVARSDEPLEEGDVVVAVGDEAGLALAERRFGEPSDARLESDRSDLDLRRVFVSNREVVGRRIGELDLSGRLGAVITRIRRGDVELVATPETRLEYGDLVLVVANRSRLAEASERLGDSIRGTAETDFGAVALGILAGVAIGMVPLPLPGGGLVRLGLAGGPLLAGLVLGRIGRTGRMRWIVPTSASLTIRELGLILFLAGVGVNAGGGFVQTLADRGLPLLLAGAAVTGAVTSTSMLLGHFWLRLPFPVLVGVASGIQTQPACLAYARDLTESDAPSVGYANAIPVAMVTKIVAAQTLLAWLP